MKTELAGNLVRLRPLRKTDMHRRANWTGDHELVSLMGADPTEEPFVSREDEERRNVEWRQNRRKAGDRLYAIEANGRYLGDIDVEFFPEAHKAEMTVFIGDRSEWGKGYGTETVRLVLAELSSDPRVDHVEVDVPKGNERGLGFWTRLGFQEYATDERGSRWLRQSTRLRKNE